MKLEFNSEAEQELDAAFTYYESHAPGLGDRLLAELNEALDLLLTHPEAGNPIPPNLRRLVLKRFPFVLYYNWDPERLRIQVIAHQHRNPGYWRTRRQSALKPSTTPLPRANLSPCLPPPPPPPISIPTVR